MLCLNSTDVIEGGASVASVVDYHMSGLVGTTFTQLAAGTLSDTLTAVLYTAGAAVSVVNITLVNTHSAAVNVTLRLDPADGGNPRYIIPETISLGAGYSLHTDGTKIVVMDASGQIQTGSGGIAIDKIWDAAGDLVQGTGADTAAKLTKGTALALLKMNSAGTAIEWGTAGQIAFPATAVPSADPNTLDDYEEGTWTPAIVLATPGNSATTVYGAIYTKIGNIVHIETTVRMTKGTGTGNITMSGLPFTAYTDAESCGMPVNLVPYGIGTATEYPVSYLSRNSTSVLLTMMPLGTGATTPMTDTDLGATAYFRIAASYRMKD